MAITVFLILVCSVLALSFYLGKKARSAQGYFAAHGQVHWFINGVAFAGDYLSAASFLGICGLIAFYGYDGFLYSIGFLAGWVVALFVIAEPIKRLGRFTFADALDSRFNSRAIKLTAAISTLVVSLFYLIPQMVGAGTLIKPLLHLPIATGIVGVGAIVILIVVMAGMVSTTWVQFIKGSLLVLFCALLTIGVLVRGLNVKPADEFPRRLDNHRFSAEILAQGKMLQPTGGWIGKPYVRIEMPDHRLSVWRFIGMQRFQEIWPGRLTECQVANKMGERVLINGLPRSGENELRSVGYVYSLGTEKDRTGPLGPMAFLSSFGTSDIGMPASEDIKEADGSTTTVYYANITPGSDVLTPGGHPTLFKGLRAHPHNAEEHAQMVRGRWNFISLMLALFCGTAALPHILIRYYTVKDQAAARKSTVVGIISIGLFYVLTLYLGLGAVTSHMLDPTDYNMAAPMLAQSFGNAAFALISGIAFTTVLGTVSGLIMAASGAVAHDLISNVFRMNLGDHAKVRAGKIAAVCVGIIAILLGIAFQKMSVAFLVGWAFNVAASANLPAIVMLLFWRGTTRQGIAASILVGLLSSLIWIFSSADAFQYLYGFPALEAAKRAWVPFNQPAIVTVPLAFLTVFVVSLFSPRENHAAHTFQVHD